MTSAEKQLSEADYLRYELGHDGKHEFEDGEILAMTGAEPTHNEICGNLEGLLRRALRPNGCWVWSRDQRVRVSASRYYYPDIVVACGGVTFANDSPASLINPTTVIEVTSETTAHRDWGIKRRHYQRLESLRQYVIIECPEPAIAVWTRAADGRWAGDEDVEDGTVSIAGASLRLSDIYAGVPELVQALGGRQT